MFVGSSSGGLGEFGGGRLMRGLMGGRVIFGTVGGIR